MGLQQKWVIVVGDGKTYDLLQDIKSEYGSHLKWLIPMPGDWHILLNYQKTLMKIYGDAGLVQLGKVAGYRGETLTSLVNCSNFRRTHAFLLQSFEAFYRFFLSLFLAKCKSSTAEINYEEHITHLIQELLTHFTSISGDDDVDKFRHKCKDLFSGELCTNYDKFISFMETLSQQQETIHFWFQFVFKNCFAYLGLYTALRYRNWDVRNGSIKLMAAVFTALDRPVYQRLIPQHLKDLVLTIPECILRHLKNGGFSVRITPSEWHAVALDECHEMKINKDAKLAIIRPNEEKMKHLSNYLSFRSACINNLESQLFPERQQRKIHLPNHTSSRDVAIEVNAEQMLKAIANHGMFSSLEENQGLWNFLDNKQATPEQSHDLLQLRKIGQEAFENYVCTTYLNTASTDAPVRKKRLCTFSVSKAQKQRIKLVEQERKISQRYLKRQLAWATKNGIDISKMEGLLEPISLTPRALVGIDGLPYKATKSSTTNYLQKRYKNSGVVINVFPAQWVPDTVILEGMFLIQTAPIPTMKYMKEYAKFLLTRFIRQHLNAGATEVHVVFDNPGSMPESPKEIEQGRRDAHSSNPPSDHTCFVMNHDMNIPDKWRTILECRKCKSNLTSYVASAMLELVPQFLATGQEFITNIRETAYSVGTCGHTEPRPNLWTNADEADLRVWLHCLHSSGTRKLIFSLDTDVYHIGLTLTHIMTTSDVIIQLSKTLTDNIKLLHLNTLINALATDPDLAGILSNMQPQVLQTLYVCTGCDYISFFASIGKTSFLSTLFQYASFIAGGIDPPGSIGDIQPGHDHPAVFSFFRLVGCAYFRTHSSAFELQSPVALYHSVKQFTTVWDHHDKWLRVIRQTVWQRADKESQNMPSTKALELHWHRCIWVLQMWNCCTQNDIELPGQSLATYLTVYC